MTTFAKDFRNFWPRGSQITMIFDVGANVGQSSLQFVGDFPEAEIHAFEPVQSSYDKLKNNTACCYRIHCHKLALSNHEGTTTINTGPESALNSFYKASWHSTQEAVPVTTLDKFCTEKNISNISLLKIDAEGHDLHVLSGANELLSRAAVAFIQVEASPERHGNFIGIQEYIDALKPLHYELFRFYDQMPHLLGRITLEYFNAIFVLSKLVKG